MSDLAHVLNAQHDKINQHTETLKTIQAQIAAIDGRLTALEADTKMLVDFAKSLNEWVTQIKEIV